jgi:CP family cyanate transporter-like MFS transporter
LSTLAQSSGYLLATVGPFGMGLLHSATGGWTLPLVLLLVLALVQIVVSHLITGAAMAGKPSGAASRRAAAGRK